jgi:hypothetical protein
MPGLNNSEPNNMKAPELCTVANYTTTAGTPSVWGWADASCLGRYASICKILRRQLCFSRAPGGRPLPGTGAECALAMQLPCPACLTAGGLDQPLSACESCT